MQRFKNMNRDASPHRSILTNSIIILYTILTNVNSARPIFAYGGRSNGGCICNFFFLFIVFLFLFRGLTTVSPLRLLEPPEHTPLYVPGSTVLVAAARRGNYSPPPFLLLPSRLGPLLLLP